MGLERLRPRRDARSRSGRPALLLADSTTAERRLCGIAAVPPTNAPPRVTETSLLLVASTYYEVLPGGLALQIETSSPLLCMYVRTEHEQKTTYIHPGLNGIAAGVTQRADISVGCAFRGTRQRQI